MKEEYDKICLWTDGYWCYYHELEICLTYKSDDYKLITLPEDMDEEEVFKYLKESDILGCWRFK